MKLTERAIRSAFFSNESGTVIIDFQFTPVSIEFEKSTAYHSSNMNGFDEPDIGWISGVPSHFALDIFIDRTSESLGEKYTEYEGETLQNTEFYYGYDKYNQSGIIKEYIKSAKNAKANFKVSDYAVNAVFAKNAKYNETIGVFQDLANLLYFITPLGNDTLPVGDMTKKGVVVLKNFKTAQFSPPPVILFFYGDFWKKGFLSRISYSLSAMNKNLIPRRLMANLEFIELSGGVLKDIDIKRIMSTAEFFKDFVA
jgi:hypothetical protein